ncbi:c-type cytochrome [Devosia epidermidihirudinis]|uniref:c-type cytochrome n=1 Tax=Devosia epidermidihirudinis TaxID=1293439 RepID=UPI000696FD3F|nr:cytochrome c [Devosia epidermidihirudinis]
MTTAKAKRTLRSRLAIIAVLPSFVIASTTAYAEDNLPSASFTAAQAQRGHDQYRRNCLDCHGENLDDGEFGGAPLRGNSFRSKWFDSNADFLFDYMQAAMPPDRPGTLSDATYADILAYVLSRNNVAAGSAELPSNFDALAELMIRQ